MNIMEEPRTEIHQAGASEEAKNNKKQQFETIRVEKLYGSEIFEVPRIAHALVEIAEYFEIRLAELRIQNGQTKSVVSISKTGCLAGSVDVT